VLGWKLNRASERSIGSLRNFPLQTADADYLRLVAFYLRQAGLEVVALVHDSAVLHVEQRDEEEAIRTGLAVFDRASEELIDPDFLRLQTKVEVARYPDHYPVDRGKETLEHVRRILGQGVQTPSGGYAGQPRVGVMQVPRAGVIHPPI